MTREERLITEGMIRITEVLTVLAEVNDRAIKETDWWKVVDMQRWAETAEKFLNEKSEV